ncbi:MAG: hypothetical protein WC054_01235 [Candidatus Nanopelagicales bacterium]
MKSSTRVWDAWLAVTLGSFVTLEVYAFRTGRFPTLTRALQLYLGINPKARHGRVAPVLFMLFWAWLTGHLTEVEIRRAPGLSRRLFLVLESSHTPR